MSTELGGGGGGGVENLLAVVGLKQIHPKSCQMSWWEFWLHLHCITPPPPPPPHPTCSNCCFYHSTSTMKKNTVQDIFTKSFTYSREISLRLHGRSNRQAQVQKMAELQRNIDGWEGKDIWQSCSEFILGESLWWTEALLDSCVETWEPGGCMGDWLECEWCACKWCSRAGMGTTGMLFHQTVAGNGFQGVGFSLCVCVWMMECVYVCVGDWWNIFIYHGTRMQREKMCVCVCVCVMEWVYVCDCGWWNVFVSCGTSTHREIENVCVCISACVHRLCVCVRKRESRC